MFAKLLSVEEARQIVLAKFAPLGTTRVGLDSAGGNFLAETISSPIDLPAFPNSSMDGFAVIAADIGSASRQNSVELRVVGDIPAGVFPTKGIKRGEAMRIMTGAWIPEGADAVVPVELTDQGSIDAEGKLPEKVRITSAVEAGSYIRKVGEDVKKGSIVLAAGKLLRPQEIGFLAMLGISKVLVRRRPKVALFATGDELLNVNEAFKPGKIYDANTYTLSALAHKYGCRVVKLGIAPDLESSIEQLLNKAVELKADLIVSSAGVSVGAFDYVRSVVEKHGTLNFWKVNMRPGKPLTFGEYKGIPFIGLPGNPVSAFVGFEVFIRPAILKMRGSPGIEDLRVKAQLLEPVESDGRESYLRGYVYKDKDRFVARLVSHQGSGNLFSLVMANAFLIVPSEVKSLPIGAEVEAWIMDEIGVGIPVFE